MTTFDPFRRGLDTWFPTLLRYLGVALIVYEPFVDSFSHPPVFFGGLGLVGLKEFWPGWKTAPPPDPPPESPPPVEPVVEAAEPKG